MFSIQKLKSDRSINGLLPAFAALVSMSAIGLFWGRETAFKYLAVVFWVYALYTLLGFVRTHNAFFAIPAFYQIFAGIVIYKWEPKTSSGADSFLSFATLLTLIFLVATIYVIMAKKIKWRGREILEIAAASVDATNNGYTSRPLTSGKAKFSRQEILDFAQFARKTLIAVPYIGKDKIVFVPVMMGREFGFVLGLKGDYMDETWVAFDLDGNTTVNISHRDYLKFTETLSFEKLCESLGSLFSNFIQMHQAGEGVRIIDRMDQVNVGFFS